MLIQRYVTAGSMDANVLYQHVQLDIDMMQAREAMDRKIAQERQEEDRTLQQEHDDMALTRDARDLQCNGEVQLSGGGAAAASRP